MKQEKGFHIEKLIMPDHIVAQNGYQESPTGSVAVVALANALLDMYITVKDDTLIKKYGLPLDGQVEVVETQQKIFTEILENYPVEYLAGGSAQNSVRLVARLTSDHIQQQQGGEGNNHQHQMLLPDPFPSYVIGKIGSDRTGIILRHLLAQDGVRTRYIIDEEKATGCCAAIVRSDGNRCLAANIGAARGFYPEQMDRIGAYDLIDRTTVLYVEGFFASHSPEAALSALRRAHLRGGVVRILSLSAPYICREFYSQIRELLPYASLVVGNEDEFRALADGMQGSSDCQQQEGSYWSESSIADVARRIAASHYVISGAGQDSMNRRLADFHGNEWEWTKLDERLAVVTCGGAGAVAATSSDVWEFPLNSTEQLRPEEIVDATGAGDAFLAGFLSKLLCRSSLTDCISAGQRTARLVIGRIGCQLP